MHDIRAIRENPAAFDAALKRRGLPHVSGEVMTLDGERRAAQTTLGERQDRRHALAKEIGQLRRNGADTAALEAEAVSLRDDMVALEARVGASGADLDAQLASLPNILDP